MFPRKMKSPAIGSYQHFEEPSLPRHKDAGLPAFRAPAKFEKPGMRKPKMHKRF